jgi:predicted RNase H-like HicB family nuclease
MKPRIWVLKNPYTLPMSIKLLRNGRVTATFPALPGCVGTGANPDEAILSAAKAIQRILSPNEPRC